MSSKLKGKDPSDSTPARPKIAIFGSYGVSKTWGALSFPNVYFIDSEGGSKEKEYIARLKASGGVYMGPEDGAVNMDNLIEEVKSLATEKHAFKTLVIDSITKPFNAEITKEAERLGDKNGFGADKRPAVQKMKRLMMWLDRLDMNVILVAHEKPKWANGEQAGVEADMYEKINYDLHLVLRISKQGTRRVARVDKTRIRSFPDGDSFDWTKSNAIDDTTARDEFIKRFGDGVMNESKAIVLASPDQVAEIERLLALVKTDPADIEKWKSKANADTFAEFNEEQAAAIISHLNKKINPTSK